MMIAHCTVTTKCEYKKRNIGVVNVDYVHCAWLCHFKFT